MAQINFVRQQVKTLSKLSARDKKIFKVVATMTAVFLLCLVGVIGARFYFLKELKKVVSSQVNFREKVKNYESREKDFVLFVNKLEVLSDIFCEASR